MQVDNNQQVGIMMEKIGIVPDVLPKAPTNPLEVIYGSTQVKFGTKLKPSEVAKQPKIKWNIEENSYYTVCMIDPDAPSRTNPKAREWQHWLVCNIPANDIAKGEVLTSYAGSTPPKGTGLHRYVLVVYKQPGMLKFDEPKISDSGGSRAKFSIFKFSSKYKLGDPIAGNFFQSEWAG